MRAEGRVRSPRATKPRQPSSTLGRGLGGASRRRPSSHRRTAAILLLAGVAMVVTNDAVVIGAAPAWLTPAGLHELYSFVGFMSVAAATWWFGWFDRR
jgi:hypothetical protein